MKQTINYRAFIVACSSLLAAFPVSAATNPYFSAGDLMLYFQKEGSTNTVYADLGNAATVFRGTAAGPDAANQVNFLNVNAALTSAFGSGWASDTSIYSGLAGVYSSNNTSSALVNGDPYRTVYVSSARDSIGTIGTANSSTWVIGGNTTMTDAASSILTQNNVFANNYTTQVAVSPTSLSQIGVQNPFLSTHIQGLAFNAFDGGVQQRGTSGAIGSVSGVGNVEFALDLYRVLAKNTVSGQVAGDLRSGSFEGTITIGSTGGVSFMTSLTAVPEPSTLLFSGLLTLSGLTLRSRRNALFA